MIGINVILCMYRSDVHILLVRFKMAKIGVGPETFQRP